MNTDSAYTPTDETPIRSLYTAFSKEKFLFLSLSFLLKFDDPVIPLRMAKKGNKRSSEKADNTTKTTIPPSFDSELDALFSAASASTKSANVESDHKATKRGKSSDLKVPATKAAQLSQEDDDEEVGSDAEIEGLVEVEQRSEDDEGEEEPMTNEIEDGESVVLSEEEEDDDNKSDSDPSKLIHETLLAKNGKKKEKKRKAIDDEPQEARDRRSIFVGNLPISLVKSRPGLKALQKHLIEQSPYPSATHIQSIRLRSIPFSKPTDDYEARNQEEADNKMKKRQRSRAYKEALNEATGDYKEKKQTFLTGSQKRKVAFITQQLNEKADTVNAYITLSPLTEKRLAVLKEISGDNIVDNLTASALAALLARSAHGSTFEGRHLRVDIVSALLPSELIESGLDTIKTADGSMLGATAGGGGADQESRRRTAFVGNMDFETKDEEVLTFFNALMIDERGQPPALPKLDFSRCTKLPKPEKAFEESQVLQQASWVQDVRIIRDSATQMGKGFSYVKFLDAACVDEIMAMHETEEAFLAAAKSGKSNTPIGQFRRKLKLKGRPLRVSRCKVPKGHVIPTKRGRDTNEGNNISTPKAKNRSRSTGAPTPGGTSPFAKRQKMANGRGAESPTARRVAKIQGDNEKPAIVVSNPSPKNNDPLKAAQLAQKKADPERQAKRMAKKNAKRASLKITSEMGTKGKVSLKPNQKKNGGKAPNAHKKSHSAKVRKPGKV